MTRPLSRSMIRMFSRVLPCLLLLLVTGCASGPDRREPANIVLILADDLGWGDLGCYGNTFHETPHIDALAAGGMRFTSAYSCGPNCAPTRACLISGQYTPRHGVYTVSSSARGKAANRKLIPIKNRTDLEPAIVTLPEQLSSAGYVTATMGKWHLGEDPGEHGFDVNVAGTNRGSPRSYFSPYKNPRLEDGPEGENLTDRLTDEAIAFLRKHRDERFFLYLPYFAVHTPIQGKPALVEKYRAKEAGDAKKRPGYAAMVETLDANVGRVVAALRALHLERDTVVIFYSDNGGHGQQATMGPLRGAKGMLYEGGVRVPLIVRWPGRVASGSDCDTPVTSVDMLPTILAMAGRAPLADTIVDGESFVPLLDSAARNAAPRAIYWHFPAYLQRTGRGENPWRTTPARAIRLGDYKLIEFFEDGTLELYDVRDDIGETRNLASTRPELTRAMHRRLVDWGHRVDAPIPTELNPAYVPVLPAGN